MLEGLRSGAWLTGRRLRVWSAMALAGFVITLLFLIFTSQGGLDFKGRPLGTDFLNVWAAGRLALDGAAPSAWDYARHGQEELAVFPTLKVYYGWHYPPPFLMLAALLALMPYAVALAVWLAASFEALRQSARGLGFNRLAALAFPGLFINITHGHNGFLASALLLGGLRLLESRPWLGGALLGCLSFKPQLGVMIPIALIAAGLWRAVGGAVLATLGLAFLSWLVLGQASWLAFYDSQSLTRHAVLELGAIGFGKMQNVFAAVRLLGGGVEAAWATQVICALLAAVAVGWFWRPRAGRSLADKSLLLVLGTLLATPYLLDYDLMILAVPLLLKAHERRFKPFEISYLALLWGLPLLARPLGVWLHLPPTPLVALLGLGLLVSNSLPTRKKPV